MAAEWSAKSQPSRSAPNAPTAFSCKTAERGVRAAVGYTARTEFPKPCANFAAAGAYAYTAWGEAAASRDVAVGANAFTVSIGAHAAWRAVIAVDHTANTTFVKGIASRVAVDTFASMVIAARVRK
jgi:hypothetical protein